MYYGIYDSFIFFTPDFFLEHCIFIFIIGLFFGSFLNVCIYRIPLGQSIVFPGSHCFSCGLQVSWYDNIPLLSYILLRGRCRSCKTTFSSRYFFIEFLTGVLYLLAFLRFRYSYATIFYLGFISSLIVAAFTDIDHWIIPDRISIGGFIIALIVAFFGRHIGKEMIILKADPFYGDSFIYPFLNSFVGAFAGFFILWFIGFIGSIVFKKEAMGWGAIKLFAYIGAVMGIFNTILILSLSSLLGATIGLSSILVSKFMNSKNDINLTLNSYSQPEKENSLNSNTSIDNLRNTDVSDNFIQNDNLKIDKFIKTLNEQSERKPYHQLPFGPYICLASIIILFLENKINSIFDKIFIP